MFNYEEAQNLIKLINRVELKGIEATTVALLIQKLSQVQPDSKPESPEDKTND